MDLDWIRGTWLGTRKQQRHSLAKWDRSVSGWQPRYFPFGSSQTHNDDEPWYQRWNSIRQYKRTGSQNFSPFGKMATTNKSQTSLLLYFIKHFVSHSASHLITVSIHLLRIIFPLVLCARALKQRTYIRERGPKRYEFDYARVIAAPCKGEEGQKERKKNNRKSIIILVIVFGIRFALFCYLPIHSITLSFVASSFFGSHTTSVMAKRKNTHSIYTHIRPPFTQTPTAENQEASERWKKSRTYFIWIRLTYI